jgi:hypothetical protein
VSRQVIRAAAPGGCHRRPTSTSSTTDVNLGEAACQGTFVLPGGQVAIEFFNSAPPVKIAAITGGTGRYRNAGGEAKIVEFGDGTGSVTFSLGD